MHIYTLSLSVLLAACVLSLFSHVQLSVTLWAETHQAPLSIGFSRQECWSRLPCPLPGDLPNPGIKPTSPASPAAPVLQAKFFATEPSVYK